MRVISKVVPPRVALRVPTWAVHTHAPPTDYRRFPITAVYVHQLRPAPVESDRHAVVLAGEPEHHR